VVNGSHHWGLPKQLATFHVTDETHGVVKVEISAEGGRSAKLSLRSGTMGIAVRTTLVPSSFLEFGQLVGDRLFRFIPQSKGKLRTCSLIDMDFSGGLFPEMVGGTSGVRRWSERISLSMYRLHMWSRKQFYRQWNGVKRNTIGYSSVRPLMM